MLEFHDRQLDPTGAAMSNRSSTVRDTPANQEGKAGCSTRHCHRE